MPVASTQPLTGLIFALEVDGVRMATFPTCSGLGSTSAVVQQKTTAPDGTTVIRKVPGPVTWSNLVFERGLAQSSDLWTWRQQVVDGKVDAARKNGAVVAIASDGTPLMRWEFIAGWPCRWLVSSTDTAGRLAIEQLEIAHEGLKLRVL
jgi:phage tail-like protein